jgi:uncharacterized protein (DUF169 family)
MTYADIEKTLLDVLHLRQRPVAIAFRDAAPEGLSLFTGAEPSGCSFWRLAAEGQTFYTRPADHYNCPIGSYTHNVPLPAERAGELEQTLKLMTGIGYVKMEEVPGIPRLERSPDAIIYAPLGDAPVEPDVVLVAGRPGNLMIFCEAATRAGVELHGGLMGRPTCMAVPAAIGQGMVASLGCIGNRVYTDLPADELYVVVRGKQLAAITEQLKTIADANRTLSDYHEGRRKSLATQ